MPALAFSWCMYYIWQLYLHTWTLVWGLNNCICSAYDVFQFQLHEATWDLALSPGQDAGLILGSPQQYMFVNSTHFTRGWRKHDTQK